MSVVITVYDPARGTLEVVGPFQDGPGSTADAHTRAVRYLDQMSFAPLEGDPIWRFMRGPKRARIASIELPGSYERRDSSMTAVDPRVHSQAAPATA